MSALSNSPLAAHVGKHPGEPHVMDPELITDPFGGYGALREQGPVVRGRFMDDSPVWLVTRFEEVRQVLRDQRFVNNPAAPSLGRSIDESPAVRLLQMLGLPDHFRPYLLGSILNYDAPDHTRMRRAGLARLHGTQDHRPAAAGRADHRRAADPASRARRGRCGRPHPALRLPPADHRDLRTGRHRRSGSSAMAEVGSRPRLAGAWAAEHRVPGDDRARP